MEIMGWYMESHSEKVTSRSVSDVIDRAVCRSRGRAQVEETARATVLRWVCLKNSQKVSVIRAEEGG